MVEDEVERDALLAGYEVERPPPAGRPWVLANMVAGLDGSAAIDGRVRGLSGAVDRALFVHLRSLADVVLVGAATVRAEGYGPVKLPAARRTARVRTGKPETPPLAVVTRSLALDWDGPAFADAGPRPLVVTAASAPREARAEAERRADVLVAGDTSVDLGAALAALGDAGAEVVLTEGGPTLLGELVVHGLLDELCLTLAPVLGGDALPIAVWPAGSRPSAEPRLAAAREVGGHLFLRYLLGGP